MANVSTIQGVSAMQANIDAQNTQPLTASGVVLEEEKCLGYINLRVKADDHAAKAAVQTVIGCELPTLEQLAFGGGVRGDVSSEENITCRVLCFSPNEWLIITPTHGETAMIEALQKALSDYHSLVADVTGGTTQLNITGQHAQDLLEKGTYVDLHDSVFAAGRLYATQIAHAPATIIKNGRNDFSLIVRRSFANHIAEWALDGGREFGVSLS